jgi:hypothetical protein
MIAMHFMSAPAIFAPVFGIAMNGADGVCLSSNGSEYSFGLGGDLVEQVGRLFDHVVSFQGHRRV